MTTTAIYRYANIRQDNLFSYLSTLASIFPRLGVTAGHVCAFKSVEDISCILLLLSGALVLLVADSAVIHTTMGGWFLIYPSLAFTFAVMLPIGALVNHLKRCWRFDFSMIHEIKATTQPQSIWEVTHPPQEGSDGGHLKTT